MPDGLRKRNGRPPWDPTPDQRQFVMVLRSNGITMEVICKLMKVDYNTLRKHCAQELADGFDMIKAHMGAAMVRKALSGDVNAMKYWLATHGGPEWRVPKDQADAIGLHDGSNDEPWIIMMPENGRDRPEEDDGPIIEGEAEEAA